MKLKIDLLTVTYVEKVNFFLVSVTCAFDVH